MARIGCAVFKCTSSHSGKNGDEISKTADALYDDFAKAGVEVLYDDRDVRAERSSESDLLGIPKRIIVGKDAVHTGVFEVVNRATETVEKILRTERSSSNMARFSKIYSSVATSRLTRDHEYACLCARSRHRYQRALGGVGQ